jgi:cytochrome c2
MTFRRFRRLAIRLVPAALGLGLAAFAATAIGQTAAPAAATASAPVVTPADWGMQAREIRRQQLASLHDWAQVPGQAGTFQVPLDVMFQRVLADPTLLKPVPMVLAPANTPEEKGQQIFTKLQPCSTCHATSAADVAPKLCPRLHGRFGGIAKITGGLEVPFDEAYVHESIATPTAKVAEGFQPVMPQLPVSDEDIANLTAYIKSLK